MENGLMDNGLNGFNDKKWNKLLKEGRFLMSQILKNGRFLID